MGGVPVESELFVVGLVAVSVLGLVGHLYIIIRYLSFSKWCVLLFNIGTGLIIRCSWL